VFFDGDHGGASAVVLEGGDGFDDSGFVGHGLVLVLNDVGDGVV